MPKGMEMNHANAWRETRQWANEKKKPVKKEQASKDAISTHRTLAAAGERPAQTNNLLSQVGKQQN